MYFASDCEFATFLRKYFTPGVTHIASQIDYEPGETQRIARELGISHPRDREGGPWTISTDLLVTEEREGQTHRRAINVKHLSFDTSNRRYLALCALERAYHHERGATFSRCLSRGLNTNWARNLLWLYPSADSFFRYGFSEKESSVHGILLRGLQRFHHANTVRELCQYLAEERRIAPAALVRAYRSLLATQCLWTSMNSPDLMSIPPASLVMLKRPEKGG